MSDAFDALACGNVAGLAAALEDARSRGRAAIVVSTLLCRCDLSPRRVEQLGRAWCLENAYLAHAEAIRGFGPTPDESADRVRVGLLHGYAALVLRACGPDWPEGVTPGAVAWALARVVSERGPVR